MKTWLITGCSSGIGRGIAKAALEAGDQVVVTARNIDKVKELADACPERALALALDVENEADIPRAVSAAAERFGGIDVLVNNAGYGYRAAIEESEPEAVRRLFQVNVFGPLTLIQTVLPIMRAQGGGTIVNITSIGGMRGAVGNGMYSAAKGAMELLSDTLHKECAPLGIRVLTVEPGAFRTGFYGSLMGTGRILPDYADTAGKWHIENVTDRHDQPGDPDKAGELIAGTVAREDMPKRLALGSDAVRIICEEYQSRLAELEAWSAYSAQTDFSEEVSK